MPIIAWDGSIAIGHAVIDEQHKTLVDIINKLHTAITDGSEKKDLQRIFMDLYRYSLYHFQEEDAIMNKSCYKLRREHQHEHESFVNELDALAAKVKNGDAQIGMEALNWLVGWLLNHISVTDKKLATCLLETD